MNKTYKLTAERLQELQNELNYIRTVREREIAEQIKEARSFGDLSENCEYDEAKNEQGKVFSRMVELENIISHAVIIEKDNLPCDSVVTGCRVAVTDLDSREREIYTLVGSQEANPLQSLISDESPFGRALLGGHIGDTVAFEVPAGTLRYQIESIEV